jgi:arylsulfatase
MRHKQRMAKYPSEPPAYGVPYEGIDNLRPETEAAVEAFLVKKRTPTM